jgi:hypothetical protein
METAKKALRIFFLSLAGALLNLGAMFLFQDLLRLPLFMDTMFTAAFTFFAGLPCGLVTAVMSHIIINPLLSTDLPNYLYIICSIAVAVVTAFFMRLFPAECSAGLRRRRDVKFAGPARFGRPPAPPPRNDGFFDRIAVLFVLSLAMCMAVSLLGGLVSTLIETFFIPRNTYDDGIFIFRKMLVRKFGEGGAWPSLLAVEILCRVPVNILDRLIAVFGGYGFALVLTALGEGAGRRAAGPVS